MAVIAPAHRDREGTNAAQATKACAKAPRSVRRGAQADRTRTTRRHGNCPPIRRDCGVRAGPAATPSESQSSSSVVGWIHLVCGCFQPIARKKFSIWTYHFRSVGYDGVTNATPGDTHLGPTRRQRSQNAHTPNGRRNDGCPVDSRRRSAPRGSHHAIAVIPSSSVHQSIGASGSGGAFRAAGPHVSGKNHRIPGSYRWFG